MAQRSKEGRKKNEVRGGDGEGRKGRKREEGWGRKREREREKKQSSGNVILTPWATCALKQKKKKKKKKKKKEKKKGGREGSREPNILGDLCLIAPRFL